MKKMKLHMNMEFIAHVYKMNLMEIPWHAVVQRRRLGELSFGTGKAREKEGVLHVLT
jgi:hypothetical protein